MNDYVVKDSGERQQFDTGAVRDTQTGKPRYDLISPLALRRIAMLMARGAEKYGERNWEKGMPRDRLVASALRHLYAAIEGAQDGEDHLAATCFNVMAIMHFEELGPMKPVYKPLAPVEEWSGLHCWAPDPISLEPTHCTRCGLWYGHHLTPSGTTTICRPKRERAKADLFTVEGEGTPEAVKLTDCQKGKHTWDEDGIGALKCVWCGVPCKCDSCEANRRIEKEGLRNRTLSRGGCAPTEVDDVT